MNADNTIEMSQLASNTPEIKKGDPESSLRHFESSEALDIREQELVFFQLFHAGHRKIPYTNLNSS